MLYPKIHKVTLQVLIEVLNEEQLFYVCKELLEELNEEQCRSLYKTRFKHLLSCPIDPDLRRHKVE